MKRTLSAFLAFLVGATLLSAQSAAPKYGIKSGKMVVSSEMMGQKILATSYFDNFGEREATVTQMGGMEIVTINKDGKVYVVNKAASMVQEMPKQETINFMDLTDSVREKYKIQEVGTESIDGRDCTIYTMEISESGQTAKTKVWVWNGFTLKSVTNAMGMEVTALVTEMEECEVEPSIFEVPQY